MVRIRFVRILIIRKSLRFVCLFYQALAPLCWYFSLEEHMGGEGSSSGCFLYLDCLSGKNSYGGQFKKTEHHLGELLLYV